jgi:hypothetical protein
MCACPAPGCGREAQKDLLDPLGLHPEGSAFHDLCYMNAYAMVRDCSLHALDGGITTKHLIFMGNYLYERERRNRDSMKWITLANERLKAMPKYDDFDKFNHALYSTTVKAGKTRPIKLEVHMRFVHCARTLSCSAQCLS